MLSASLNKTFLFLSFSDVVKILICLISETVQVTFTENNESGRRFRRSTTDLPDRLQVSFLVKGRSVDLSLTKALRHHSDITVFTMEEGVARKQEIESTKVQDVFIIWNH